MEYFDNPVFNETKGTIVCHKCGITITANESSLCTTCAKTEIDWTGAVTKLADLQCCSKCERFLEPPARWIKADFGSKELLRICIKKLRLHQVVISESRLLWTEPHSRRVKVQLIIKKNITDQAPSSSGNEVIEFIINKHMCNDCHRVQAKDYWTAKVQIRQKLDHKRTLYYLEQLILKHNADSKVVSTKAQIGGVDMMFANDNHANQMVDFVASSIPCEVSKSGQLRSADKQAGTTDYRVTTCINIVPVCRDSIVCLPPALANKLGQISQLCLVLKVHSQIRLIDPLTGQFADLSAPVYFDNRFSVLCSSKSLREFTVIEIEYRSQPKTKKPRFKGKVSSKHTIVGVWLQRSSELGTGDMIFAKTHLGRLLKEGDIVMGFDVQNSNTNDEHFEKLSPDKVPEVIIVKKIIKKLRNRKRGFHLKHMGINDDLNSQNDDYMDFLDEVEADPELRDQLELFSTENDVDPFAAADSEEASSQFEADDAMEVTT